MQILNPKGVHDNIIVAAINYSGNNYLKYVSFRY